MANDLTGQNIQDTYKRVLTVGDDGLMYDGTGSLYTPLSASHEITQEISSSYAETASFAINFNVVGNITASGNISASGKLYSTGLVMAPGSAITPSTNQQSIYFRNKLDGTGESAMEWMEIGDDIIKLHANSKEYLTIAPGYIKVNAQSQDVLYQFNSANSIIHKMQKVGDNNLNFFRDYLSVGSGSSTFPTTDGTQNATPDGTLKVWGNLNVQDGLTTDGIPGHITSSGNISSSGTITATNGFGTIDGGSF